MEQLASLSLSLSYQTQLLQYFHQLIFSRDHFEHKAARRGFGIMDEFVTLWVSQCV